MWQAKADLASLPYVALGGITDAIDTQIKSCTIPHQQLLNVNSLLGKKEGCRTISKTPMVWRMIGKCDTVVKNWESLEAGSFDTAVKDSSALSAACLRNLMAEIAVLLGFITVGLLNDFMMFFDSIDIPALIKNAQEANFPLPELALISFQHVAPRVIQRASAYSFPVQVFRSILAGCEHSIALTKGMLRNDIYDLIYHNRGCTIDTYVDDIPITSSNKSRLKFKNKILKMARMYSARCGKLGLTLSPKSESCTSDFKLSLLIVKILKKEGIHYQATRDARDLGITYTAGLLHKNSAKHIRHRFLKTSKRNTKICRIEKYQRSEDPVLRLTVLCQHMGAPGYTPCRHPNRFP